MRRLALVGLAAVALGFATLVDRGVAGFFDFNALLVSAVGVLAAVAGLRYAHRRRGATRRSADPDPPEPRYRSPVPGAAVDRALAARRVGRVPGGVDVRGRLRAAAVETLVVSGGIDPGTARRAVEEGTWTDDGVAAAYLAVPSRVPRRLVVVGFLRGTAATELCVRRTLDAIGGSAGRDRRESGSGRRGGGRDRSTGGQRNVTAGREVDAT